MRGGEVAAAVEHVIALVDGELHARRRQLREDVVDDLRRVGAAAVGGAGVAGEAEEESIDGAAGGTDRATDGNSADGVGHAGEIGGRRVATLMSVLLPWLGPGVSRHDSLSGKQVLTTVPSRPASG